MEVSVGNSSHCDSELSERTLASKKPLTSVALLVVAYATHTNFQEGPFYIIKLYCTVPGTPRLFGDGAVGV